VGANHDGRDGLEGGDERFVLDVVEVDGIRFHGGRERAYLLGTGRVNDTRPERADRKPSLCLGISSDDRNHMSSRTKGVA
jgi:hypothetical protein